MQSPPIIKDLLTDFNVSCINLANGCEAIMSYYTLEKHEKECEFEKKSCPGCKKFFLSGPLQKHVNECQEILMMFPCCSSSFKRRDAANHNETECLRRTVAILTDEVRKVKDENFALRLENEQLKQEVSSKPSGMQHLINPFSSVDSVKQNVIFSKNSCPNGHTLLFITKKTFTCFKCSKSFCDSSYNCGICLKDSCVPCNGK